jgi:hypothetical protein
MAEDTVIGAAGDDTVVLDPAIDVLGMSDEDFMNRGVHAFEAPPTNDVITLPPQEGADTLVAGEGADTVAALASVGDAAESLAGGEGADTVAIAPSDIDYKAEYEKLMAPFKANGKDMKVDSIDDALQLMQMGAGVNKKMGALKPHLKTIKLLEKNGLLDEAKLNYLIDLNNKNPQAISKLVKDAGLDPLDINLDSAEGYKAPPSSVTDHEIALDEVMNEIRSTATFDRTLAIVADEWDAPSKQLVAQNPTLLKTLNSHVANGVYDLISTEMEKEQVFGRLEGLSNLEAYQKVGAAINARGGFDHLGATPTPKPAAEVRTLIPAAKPEDEKLKAQRRAIAPNAAAAPAAKKPDFNPLAMSDEEFMKQHNPKYL